MTRLMTFLTTLAVGLVAAAQVVVAPASCCLIRAALFGGEACCHAAVATVEDGPRTCCHGRTATAEESAAGHSLPTPPSGECLWCSAGPKVVSDDRVAVPDLDAGPLFVASPAVEPIAVAPASVEFVADGPFHRTAMATCAWLCVWRK